ncbi:MAG: TetR/AcrR family transcriptional regulator [Dehalococcoidia bacterium]|nr:TetR/AcrR family transcriptional regulator [Dehalococcoidia bacterium]
MVSLNKSRNKPKSTREVQKSQIREAILEALGERLANGGLHRISIAEIAKKVDISARTVYIYFPTRDELIKALYKWSADKIASDMRNERTISLETFIARKQELLDQRKYGDCLTQPLPSCPQHWSQSRLLG